uniref:hypothetical protein n=1 Tax=uncultured Ruegeria sp. TaxID=259304 RepID=UPI00260C9EC5
AGDDQPTAGDDQPTAGDDQPTAGDDQPTAGDDQPTTEAEVETPIHIPEPQGVLMIDITNQGSQSGITQSPVSEVEDAGTDRFVWNKPDSGLNIFKKGNPAAKIDNDDGGFDSSFIQVFLNRADTSNETGTFFDSVGRGFFADGTDSLTIGGDAEFFDSWATNLYADLFA